MTKKIELQHKIAIKDIPLMVPMGEICENVCRAHGIMVAILEGRNMDAVDIAQKILDDNDAILSAQVDKDEIMKIIDQDRAKKN